MSTSDPGAQFPARGEGAGFPGEAGGAPWTNEVNDLARQIFAQLSGPSLGLDSILAQAVPGALPVALVPPGVGAAAVRPGSIPGAADPSSPSVPHSPGSSASNPGAGGMSSGLTLPPFPGAAQQPPIASGPPPKESDLRTLPAMFSESTGFSSPVTLAGLGLGSGSGLEAPFGTPPVGQAPLSAATPVGFTPLAAQNTTPYFLEIAGLPVATPVAPSESAIATPLPASALAARRHEAGATAEPGLSSSIPDGGVIQVLEPRAVPHIKSSPGIFDAATIKRDFPILAERVHGRPLIWLDNAATTQKPRAVIDRLSYYYEHENSNVHRAAHALAARATDAYEAARDKVRRFLNAPSVQEIVFARGATEAINLVAQSWGRRNVAAGDEILITWLEHHANIVPWQQLCSDRGARLCVAPVDSRGQVILEEYEKLLGPRTRLVSFTQVSNALGTVLPVRQMVDMAHRAGARVLVDGAQAVSHMPVDVQALDCDFYCFSGHKIFAPTGIGVLFGKAAVLEAMPPWQGGGNMIADVTFEKTRYQPPPYRFEAGTGSIADAVGLGAALDYVTALGIENINRYEHDLLGYATDRLGRVPGLRMIGTAAEKAGVLSFVLDGIRTEDVGAALDQEGIAVRSGHHCAQPILRRYGLESTIRASLAPYNTPHDIDALVAALLRMQAGRPPRGL
jgi:cysteine desulfurase / selenocysteine lyase